MIKTIIKGSSTLRLLRFLTEGSLNQLCLVQLAACLVQLAAWLVRKKSKVLVGANKKFCKIVA